MSHVSDASVFGALHRYPLGRCKMGGQSASEHRQSLGSLELPGNGHGVMDAPIRRLASSWDIKGEGSLLDSLSQFFSGSFSHRLIKEKWGIYGVYITYLLYIYYINYIFICKYTL